MVVTLFRSVAMLVVCTKSTFLDMLFYSIVFTWTCTVQKLAHTMPVENATEARRKLLPTKGCRGHDLHGFYMITVHEVSVSGDTTWSA